MIFNEKIFFAPQNRTRCTTILAEPFCKALKEQSHEAPVDIPDKIRNINVLVLIWNIKLWDFDINTIIHEKISITIVLMAVAKFESIFLISHLAKIDVNPANKADKNIIYTPISIN